MAKFSRIPPADPAASVAKFARKVVQERVRAVLHYWQRVARHNTPRVEDIHQLRVWSRRSVAALSLFASQLPADVTAELAAILDKARKKAGKARDADILVASLAKPVKSRLKQTLENLHDQRDEACGKLRRSYRNQVRSDRVRDLLKVIGKPAIHTGQNGKPPASPRLGEWFREQLTATFVTFRRYLQSPKLAASRIHPLRIAGKQVRYALEIGLKTLRKAEAKQLYASLEQLQEHLGEICDHQALAEQFRELAADLKSKEHALLLSEATRHTKLARAGQTGLTRWWKAAGGRVKLLKLLEAIESAGGSSRTRGAPPRHRRKSQEK